MWPEARHHWEGRSQPGENSKVWPLQRSSWDHQGMSGPWCHCFKGNSPPPTAGDELPQPHSSDQAPSELLAKAEDISSGQQKGRNWTVARWTKVLFTDDSKFCTTFGNKGPRVWRLPGEENQPGCTKSSVKFPQSVMVWGAKWRLVVLNNSASWSLMLMPASLPASPWVFHAVSRRGDLRTRRFHAPARFDARSQCQINNEVVRRPWHWGAPLACKFTKPQSNREFVGTGEKENVEGATKHPRGIQRCHSKRRAWNSVTPEGC